MSLALIITLIVFGLLMFFSIPLTFAMLLSSILYFLISGKSLYLVAHRVFTGIDVFTLMAIPFFILAAELMVYSGTAEKLLSFSNLLVGRFKGGLAYVNVLASMLFGGCSGSAVADVAGLGLLEIKMMEKGGYDRAFSTALTISSSIQGPIIPPSIMMVLLGALTGTSIGGLLLGGAIPGILVGLAQCSVIFFLGRKKKYPLIKESYSFHDIVIIILTSIPFLLMPIIIIGGIISGFFTPTEASAVAVAYGFILTIIAKKGMVRIKELLPIFTRSSVVSASILMLAAASNVFGWILATEKIPEMLTRAVLNVTQNRYIILLIINCFLLMWGMFMDSTPAIFILAPILFPLGVSVGMDPIHFGVVMGFNLVIGLITPPYGVALFTGTIVSGIPMEKLIKELIPFISASIAILLLITYVPEIVMFLPKLFKLHI